MSSVWCGIPIYGCKHIPEGTVVACTDGLLPECHVVVRDGKVVGKIPKFSQKQFDERVVVLKGLLAARKESADVCPQG